MNLENKEEWFKNLPHRARCVILGVFENPTIQDVRSKGKKFWSYRHMCGPTTLLDIEEAIGGWYGSTWQPIETAPLDGTVVLVCGPVDSDINERWVSYWDIALKRWYCDRKGSNYTGYPFCWMSIPEIPETED